MVLLLSAQEHLLDHSPEYLLVTTLLSSIIFLILRRRRTRRRDAPIRRSSVEKGPGREPGVWIPLTFESPAPPPYLDWDISTTKPLPYRPFRYGAKYNITMGLRKMPFEEWIELDNQFPTYHSTKISRILSRGAQASTTNPVAYDAAIELLEHLIDYLPARYPSLFTRTETGSETFDITATPLCEDPMQMAARMVQDDLAIMIEGKDGQYYLQAGSILLAGFWRLGDKLGMPLDEIHTSGDVPGYREKLAKGMNNFFARVMPGGPVIRNNYFMQADDCLAWSHSIGPEDGEQIGWYTSEANKGIEHYHFRSERQTLRRLPRSGGVVFTIRTYFLPITEMAKEPYAPGRLASAIRSWGDDVAKYKGRERWQDVLLAYLDKEHERQMAEGLEPEKEEYVYPY
ncbi:hypothetical protein B9Z19DRAFT_977084 [Tuber borchii]|uniref:Mannosyl transferase n=1 Tax=Tuber borchii TaxID=42251 RepID=A0A2T6ZWT0_TUBBO|nr:hypothetical protein B9Z19DRAFT_977084 [Tuber borchii]